MKAQRLPSGGRINRGRPIEFSFNDRNYQGFEGDTLASGLLANGLRLFGRSFKYHRPRGVFGSGSEEPNAIVQLGEGASTVPNLKATQVELFDGLSASAVMRVTYGAQLDWAMHPLGLTTTDMTSETHIAMYWLSVPDPPG